MAPFEARQFCETLAHLANCTVSPYLKAEIWASFLYYSKNANLDKGFFERTQNACGFETKTLSTVLKTRQEKVEERQ